MILRSVELVEDVTCLPVSVSEIIHFMLDNDILVALCTVVLSCDTYEMFLQCFDAVHWATGSAFSL